jgi:hypothetical protein
LAPRRLLTCIDVGVDVFRKAQHTFDQPRITRCTLCRFVGMASLFDKRYGREETVI